MFKKKELKVCATSLSSEIISLFSTNVICSLETILLYYSGKDIIEKNKSQQMWRRGVVVITTVQLHSSKPELRFCAGLNPASGVSEIRDGENF